MKSTIFFNLIADLISKTFSYPEIDEAEPLSEDSSDLLIKRVESLLQIKFGEGCFYSHDTLPLSSQVASDIINWCSDNNDYYLFRTLVCRLDAMININKLIHDYNFNNISLKESERVFDSLNDNVAESGVLIIPKVLSSQTTYPRKDSSGNPKERTGKNANYWLDDLNKRLNNIYYVKKDCLNGYHIKNVIYSLPYNKIKGNYINIGLTPICNTPVHDLLDYDDNIVKKDFSGKEFLYFGNVKVKDPKMVENMFLSSYHTACSNDIDIFVGPEMLGTHNLTLTDEYGVNKNYESLNSPSIILTPTMWEKNSNVLTVFSNEGKIIGRQFKQYRFEFTGKRGACLEDLVSPPKEVLIVHINGVGRMAFPICMDYLHEKYRNFLISTLKVDFIICPSFSFGSSNFERAIDAGAEFGVRCIWLNTCSAIAELFEPPDYIGLVSMPIISDTSTRTRIKPSCKGSCKKGCLFKIKVPLNCAGESLHNNVNVSIEHL